MGLVIDIPAIQANWKALAARAGSARPGAVVKPVTASEMKAITTKMVGQNAAK